MSLSVFDLFKIGIGPSSSHTVGPMRAAARFAEGLRRDDLLSATSTVKVELYGSLGATGKGHGSDKAVLLGLEGEHPDTVDTETVAARLQDIRGNGRLNLLGEHSIAFNEKEHLAMIRKPLAYHPNGMIFAHSMQPVFRSAAASTTRSAVVSSSMRMPPALTASLKTPHR